MENENFNGNVNENYPTSFRLFQLENKPSNIGFSIKIFFQFFDLSDSNFGWKMFLKLKPQSKVSNFGQFVSNSKRNFSTSNSFKMKLANFTMSLSNYVLASETLIPQPNCSVR